jgi:hypothetical protein
MDDFDAFLAALRQRLTEYLAGNSEQLGNVSYETGLPQQDVLAFRDGGHSNDRVLIERLAEFLWPKA